MKFYYTNGDLVGLMPDGTWQRFATENEYVTAYREAEKED